MTREGKAVFIGYQSVINGDAIALFNIEWPLNELHGSTVSIKTIKRLNLTELVDKQGNRLQGVPIPKVNR